MAHTTRSLVEILESVDARLAAIETSQAAVETAIQANTTAVLAQAADIAALKANSDIIEAELITANEIARYMAVHTYGADLNLP